MISRGRMAPVVGLTRAACICGRPIFLPQWRYRPLWVVSQPSFSLVVRGRHLILNFADCDAHNMNGRCRSRQSDASRFWGLGASTFHSYSFQYGTPERGSEGETCRLRGTKEGSP